MVGAPPPTRPKGKNRLKARTVQKRREIVPKFWTEPMGDTINFIDWNSLKTTDPENARIVDCRHVASFNWLNKKTPTIVIPGMPRAWTPLS
ncbi:hypothetical protein VHEMI03325 [[Torrubiella] hemipterigena]|uniref:Uncharacterized protein n=1 Tax=[Torrubiella] hemipterigena TaxID=1531966 RepID=A0A0A1TD37_9HYPO|nr:hypothetical protein VHEMI03325 [[Torrubiella] hemipterigena]